MKSISEQRGGTYRAEGDSPVPKIALDNDTEQIIGRYGRMHRQYLEYRPVVYNQPLLPGKLWKHLEEIDAVLSVAFSAS